MLLLLLLIHVGLWLMKAFRYFWIGDLITRSHQSGQIVSAREGQNVTAEEKPHLIRFSVSIAVLSASGASNMMYFLERMAWENIGEHVWEAKIVPLWLQPFSRAT